MKANRKQNVVETNLKQNRHSRSGPGSYQIW